MEKDSYSRSKRTLSILEGIFLVLLSFAIPLNMGYIMRSINAALLFIFGINIYGFALLLFVEGIYLTIKGHLLLPQKRWRIAPLVIFVVFLDVLMSSIQIHLFGMPETDDIIREFFTFYNHYEGGYYAKTFINLFEVPFGGGLIGYLIATPIVLVVGKAWAIAIPAIICFFMLFIMSFVFIQRLVKFLIKRAKGQREKAPKKTKEEKLKEKYKDSFVEESNIYLHADEVGADEVVQVARSNEIAPVSFNSRNELSLPDDINTHRPLTETGTLEKATLDLFGRDIKPSSPFVNETVYPSSDIVKDTTVEEFEKEEALREKEYHEENKESVFEDEAPSIELPIENPNNAEVDATKVEPEIKVEVETTKEVEIKPKKEKNILPKVEEEKVDVEIKNERINWVPPSTDHLVTYQTEEQVQANIDSALEKQEKVNKAFKDFNIQAEVVDFVIGPSITRLLIDYPSTGSVKAVDKVKLDVSRRLNGCPLRFAETVPGTQYSGFEVPNPITATVSFKEVFEALPPVEQHPTAVAFGKDISGKVVYADVCDFPHMLISGTSGSGKSVFVNSLIVTLMARTSPEDLKMVLVDPKRVEMNRYRDEPHLFCPVINDSNEAKVMLYKMVDYMNDRYKLFEEADFATSLKEYNAWARAHKRKTMPYIIIVLDEYADLAYSCKEVSLPLVSICQKARACGIHVIVSTQRPSTDVITGTIKANLNTRVSLTAAGAVDSMTVLDEGGAEDLLGNGDMLVKSPLISRTGLTRLQGCYIQGKEIAYIVNYLKDNYKPEYDENFLDLSEHEPEAPTTAMFNSPLDGEDNDETKYQWIKEWASTQDYVSMSKIQRECSVGFNRAGKILKRLQEEGILSTEVEGSNKGCKVIAGASRFNDAPIVSSDELTKKE